jgi:hypothetical protein
VKVVRSVNFHRPEALTVRIRLLASQEITAVRSPIRNILTVSIGYQWCNRKSENYLLPPLRCARGRESSLRLGRFEDFLNQLKAMSSRQEIGLPPPSAVNSQIVPALA